VELIAAAVKDGRGEITGYLGVHRDITERLSSQRALDLRARQQALLAELTLRNLAHGGLQALLDDATVLVARTLELELATIGEKLPSGGIGWRAAYGWSKEAITQAPPSPGDARSLVGYTLLVGRPIVSEDVRADDRFGISERFAERNPVSAVAVIIPGEVEPFGVLVAAAQNRRAFSIEDVDFTKSVANVVGVAVERARLSERLEQARESVRLRIARDLHDDALRELTDALALAAVARSDAIRRDEVARWNGHIAALQRVAGHLRGAVYDLRLPAEEGRSFANLLSELVAIQAGKAGSTHVWLSGGDAVPPGALGQRGVEVLRIVREALTNARLHSGALAIEVDASASTAERLALVVSDDGDWPDRDRWRSTGGGAGITGMIERAHALGSELSIDNRRGGGSRVSLEVPLATPDQAGNEQTVPLNAPNFRPARRKE
jgi:signal transduction histidine kinase